AQAERVDRLREGPSPVQLVVPGRCAHLGQEPLHARLVAGEQLSVKVARVPVDDDTAQIEDARREHGQAGLMFWFRWKTFSGSQRRLSVASLASFGSP